MAQDKKAKEREYLQYFLIMSVTVKKILLMSFKKKLIKNEKINNYLKKCNKCFI